MMSKLGHWLDEAHGIKLGPVLACADTNAATDNILEGLYRRGVDVVRLGRPSNVSRTLYISARFPSAALPLHLTGTRKGNRQLATGYLHGMRHVLPRL